MRWDSHGPVRNGRLAAVLRTASLAALLILAGCSVAPFQTDSSKGHTVPPSSAPAPGSGPVLTVPHDTGPPSDSAIEAPLPVPLPRERPRTPPATLGPASQALVSQAQAQRRKGDLPGATVSLERALRIEPNNPLLWIELGRLRMDQGNFPQAENMGRKALAMAVGDDSTQSAAWELIAQSLRARGKNPQAEEAMQRARELAPL
jgi:hypothetical protein